MDAKEFVKELARICKSKGETCDGCQIRQSTGCPLIPENVDADRLVTAVEKWSKEHPMVTNGDMVWRLIPGDVRSTEKCRAKEDFPYPENAPCYKDHYVITVTADWWEAEYKGEGNDD